MICPVPDDGGGGEHVTNIFGDGGFLFDKGIGAGDGVDGFPSGHVVGSGGIAILQLDA